MQAMESFFTLLTQETDKASITIRNIDEDLEERLGVRAALQGHSMEEEGRLILRGAVGGLSGLEVWHLSRTLVAGAEEPQLELR